MTTEAVPTSATPALRAIPSPTRVLLAEDDHDVATVVAFSVRMTWPACTVSIAPSGMEALRRFALERPELVILDVQMPAPDGFEVCRRLRAISSVPILMLTVRDGIHDKVQAFALGADDYLTKPFDHLELLARLGALMRRAHQSALPVATPTPCACGNLILDRATQTAHLGTRTVHLTLTEYRLLELLVLAAGATVTRQTLLQGVWGDTYIAEFHYLKVFIGRLRRKLGDDALHPRYIQSVRGYGYRLIVPTTETY